MMINSSAQLLDSARSANRTGLQSCLRIALIGNCQVTALADVLGHVRGLAIPHVIDVNMVGSTRYVDALFALHRRTDIDLVLMQPLSSEFDDISTNRMRDVYREDLLLFSNVYFSGLHPDLTYFGARGRRVLSPLGDYHSRIALIAHAKGYDFDRTLACYSERSFAALRYFDQYDESLREMESRHQHNDIKLSRDFAALTKNHLTMLTVNHPELITIKHLAGMICSHLRLDVSAFESRLLVSPFAGGAIWPVYEAIHRNLRLQYATPQLFAPARTSASPPMTLPTFVRRSFDLYDKQRLDADINRLFEEMAGCDDL